MSEWNRSFEADVSYRLAITSNDIHGSSPNGQLKYTVIPVIIGTRASLDGNNMCLTWGTQCDVSFGSELTTATGNLLLDPSPEPFMQLRPDRSDDGRRVGDHIYISGGRSGSPACHFQYRDEKSSRHRSPKGLDDRFTLVRWARILSVANTIRRTTHRHPELFFHVGNPGSSGIEPGVPADAKLYFFVE